MLTRILRVALLVLVPSLALAQSPPITFPPDDGGGIDFILPSGNIGCIYIPAGGTKVYQPTDGGPELSCDRREPRYVHVYLGKSGPAKEIVNPGEQGCCGSNNTLAYGQRWSAGPYTCESAETGLACTRNDGHGFSISRAAVKIH